MSQESTGKFAEKAVVSSGQLDQSREELVPLPGPEAPTESAVESGLATSNGSPSVNTIVTFADYRQDSPLIKSTNYEEFFLLFNNARDTVTLKPEWSWGKGEVADFVLKVERMDDDAEESDYRWSVSLHPESPSGARCVYPDSEAGHTFYSDDFQRNPQSLLDSTPEILSSGDVVALSSTILPHDRVFRMMLRAEIELPGKNEDPDAVDEETIPLNLMTLPDVVLEKILGELPWEFIVNVVPFVSQEMFFLAKRMTDFRVLDFGKGLVDVDDIVAVCKAAHDTCVRLELVGGCSEQQHDRYFRTVVVDFDWPNLRHFVIPANEFGFSADLLDFGLKKGNFPKVEVLEMTPNYCKLSWPWAVSSSCRWSNVKLLQLVLDLDLNVIIMLDGNWDQILHKFPNLGALRLKLLRRLLTFDFLQSASFDTLKELKIDGPPGFLSFPHGLSLFPGEQIVSLGSLERLSLGVCRHVPSPCDFRNAVDGEWLTRSFPVLRTLSLGDGLDVVWGTADASWLKGLTQLSIYLLDLHCSETYVPFELMTSLNSVWLGYGVGARRRNNFESFRGLLALPSLRNLMLDDEQAFRRLIDDLPSTKPGLLALHLELGQVVLDSVVCADIGRVCEAFPNLLLLVVSFAKVDMPEDLASVLGEKAQNLVELQISCPSGDNNGAGDDARLETPTDDYLERIRAGLPGKWAVLYPGGRYCACPVLRKIGAQPLADSFFVFRHSFFHETLSPFTRTWANEDDAFKSLV